jgi:hypothetical protein
MVSGSRYAVAAAELDHLDLAATTSKRETKHFFRAYLGSTSFTSFLIGANVSCKVGLVVSIPTWFLPCTWCRRGEDLWADRRYLTRPEIVVHVHTN